MALLLIARGRESPSQGGRFLGCRRVGIGGIQFVHPLLGTGSFEAPGRGRAAQLTLRLEPDLVIAGFGLAHFPPERLRPRGNLIVGRSSLCKGRRSWHVLIFGFHGQTIDPRTGPTNGVVPYSGRLQTGRSKSLYTLVTALSLLWLPFGLCMPRMGRPR